jgi:ribonucleotide reductase alpha subunit
MSKALQFAEGMGEAVAKRTILRRKENGEWETWADVAKRVAEGNCSLHPTGDKDRVQFEKAIADGRILMSGRHLQHGDSTQNQKTMEVFTNCSAADFSAISFYLKLNGSGVGRLYDENSIHIDWFKTKMLKLSLSPDHPDWKESDGWEIPSRFRGSKFVVPDSREGWAEAVDVWERSVDGTMSQTIELDFSEVRAKGSPIKGMQDRPSSGPIPLMKALTVCADIAILIEMSNPMKTLRIDHELAAAVEMGGVRRSAGMAGMHWTSPDIFDFIDSKKYGGLWSANHSVCVDAQFWRQESAWARKVFQEATHAAYYGGEQGQGKGEPGFINIDKLEGNS